MHLRFGKSPIKSQYLDYQRILLPAIILPLLVVLTFLEGIQRDWSVLAKFSLE
jgi:hypothetical protein